MAKTRRNCDNCGKSYLADNRNLKRGWGLTCSKSCAASKREKSKPGYCPERVAANNVRREVWNSPIEPSVVGGAGRFGGYTSEGYRVFGGVAYNEFDEPVYNVDPYEDMHPHDGDNF